MHLLSITSTILRAVSILKKENARFFVATQFIRESKFLIEVSFGNTQGQNRKLVKALVLFLHEGFNRCQGYMRYADLPWHISNCFSQDHFVSQLITDNLNQLASLEEWGHTLQSKRNLLDPSNIPVYKEILFAKDQSVKDSQHFLHHHYQQNEWKKYIHLQVLEQIIQKPFAIKIKKVKRLRKSNIVLFTCATLLGQYIQSFKCFT